MKCLYSIGQSLELEQLVSSAEVSGTPPTHPLESTAEEV